MSPAVAILAGPVNLESAMSVHPDPDAVVFWITTILCLLCALAG